MQRVIGAGVMSMVLVAACAHPSGPSLQAQLAAADDALLRGCYDCLIEARNAYRRLASAGDRATASARLFEADLLIALREGELAVPPSDALPEARRIATTLPTDLQAASYLQLVAALPPTELGSSRRELRGRYRYLLDGDWYEKQRHLLSSSRLRKPVRDYLQTALDCASPIGHPRGPGPAAAPASPPQAPPGRSGAAPSMAPAALLLRYREAICSVGEPPELVTVRTAEPRFVEVLLFIARIEIAQIMFDGSRQAKAHLDEVLARFPSSSAATYLAGNYHSAISDHAEALRHYDRTLALHADHDPAMLGRVISLSNLGRLDEAIEVATQLIARSEDERFHAHYWRARNHHALRDLGEARSDISAAKELGSSEDLLVLAGIVEFEQGDLDIAQADLTIVAGAHSLRCEAHWYLGLIDRQRKLWPTGWHAFEDAMRCYGERARLTAVQLETLRSRADLDPGYLARMTTYYQESAATDAKQQRNATFAAASCAAASADYAAARRLTDLIADDPDLSDRIATLRAWLDRLHPARP